MIGTATDPYQPAERRFELTRTILEVFRRHEGLRIGVITKSALIARDTDLLAELSRRHDVVINISLASFDARLLRRIEPRTPVPRARLRTMKTLADAGLNVGLLAAPVLPGITDGERGLRALVEAAVASGAKWAECHPLRMGPATRATLLPWLSRHRPRLLARYQLHYGDRVMANAQYSDALEHRFRTICEQAGLSGRRRTDPVAPQKDLWAQG